MKPSRKERRENWRQSWKSEKFNDKSRNEKRQEWYQSWSKFKVQLKQVIQKSFIYKGF